MDARCSTPVGTLGLRLPYLKSRLVSGEFHPIICYLLTDEVKAETEGSGSEVTLDLDQVTLVDVEAVHYLGACEANGTKILKCPRSLVPGAGRRPRPPLQRGELSETCTLSSRLNEGWSTTLNSRLCAKNLPIAVSLF